MSLIIRSLIALLGIGYIVWMVDFTDRVEVPAGTVLPNGHRLEQAASFKVVRGSYNPADPSGELVVRIDTDPDQPVNMSIPQAAMTGGPNDLRFLPGLGTMMRQANVRLLVLGLMVVSLLYPILMVRWWLLMRARGMSVSLWKAFRLTMVGNFFNFCLPGTTGGDLVKAYYAAKGSDRRADAVMSVIVDRVCGLMGLLVLAGITGAILMGSDPEAAVRGADGAQGLRVDQLSRQVTVYIWWIIGGVVVGAWVYFSRSLRRAMGIDWLIQRLPGQQLFASIDAAALAYRGHKRVVLTVFVMSVGLHLFLVTATAIAGYALGITTPFRFMLIVIPVSFLVGAIPIAPQGIGVMELFAVSMLRSPMALPNQIVGMLLLTRLYQMFYSLLGSVFLLKGDIHLHPQEPAGDAPPTPPDPAALASDQTPPAS